VVKKQQVSKGRKHAQRSGERRLRVIAGAWRGRRITFAEIPGLRPTPDRVRETLFNWLQSFIVGAHCVDLFAGSGALGFEAASRGAQQVVMLDVNPRVIWGLRETLKMLDAPQIKIIHADTLTWLNNTSQAFDIMFIDPPYGKNLLPAVFQILSQRALLKTGAHIYIEFNAAQPVPTLPTGWELLRSQKAGQVRYCLVAPGCCQLDHNSDT
jgi:16S rRNA (guanine966-N2)-methyltransferase